MSIVRIFHAGYRDARSALVMGTTPGSLARAREIAFIKRLVEGFRSQYSRDEYRVFCGLTRGNRAEFGTESLLGDIAVCRIAKSSADGCAERTFRFVSALVWQIEIELSSDWRRGIYAINRLNCGAAENRLFISAQPSRGSDTRRETFRVPLAAGAGEAYIGLVPNPCTWEDSEDSPRLWHLREGRWVECA